MEKLQSDDVSQTLSSRSKEYSSESLPGQRASANVDVVISPTASEVMNAAVPLVTLLMTWLLARLTRRK